MTTPRLPGSPPVLMVAVSLIQQSSQVQALGFVQPGAAFWADGSQAAELAAAGLAVVAPPNTAGPPLVRPYSVNGVPGLGRATQNSSPG
jgi:hypothetical protein